jgi:hypothetical protein
MDEEAPNPSMIMLTPKNYHLWIKELKKLAEQHRVWPYVNPNENKKKLTIEKLSDFYQVVVLRLVRVVKPDRG